MIGVDVVDLADPSIGAQHTDHRFLGRLLAPSEVDRLEAAEPAVRGRLLWTLWAVKEAAYKAACLDGYGGAFVKAEFIVGLDAQAGVESPAGTYRADYRGDAHRVHAVVWRGPVDPVTGALRLEDPVHDHRSIEGREALSAAARAFAVRELAGSVDGALSISDSESEAPAVLLVDGREAGIPLSLSHHGGCVAYAALPGQGRPT